MKTLGFGAVAFGFGLGCGPEQGDVEKESGEKLLFHFDMTDAFPTNEAKMNPEKEEKLKTELFYFLEKEVAKMDKDALSHLRVNVSASADERQTITWEEGNKGLAQARVAEVRRIYHEVVELFIQKNPSLKDFFNAGVITNIPVNPRYGKGVTAITDLINPDTKERYREEEAEKLPKEIREELFGKCRFVSLDIVQPSENDRKQQREKQYEELVEYISRFPVLRILIDRSGSMSDDSALLRDKLIEKIMNDSGFFNTHDCTMASFSYEIDPREKGIQSPDDVRSFVDGMRFKGSKERQLHVAQSAIDRLTQSRRGNSDKEPPAAVLVLSDEGVNDFDISNLEQMTQEAEKANITVFFAMIHDKTKLITIVDMYDLIQTFNGFVEDFQDDAYYPEDGWSLEQKRKYLMEQIKEVRHVRDEYGGDVRRGAQVAENGSVYFISYVPKVKENLKVRFQEAIGRGDRKEADRLNFLYRRFLHQ